MTQVTIEQWQPKKQGRPSKLTPELLEKAKGYIASCVDEINHTDKGAMTYVEVELPTLEGLAIYLNIHKETVQDWARVELTDDPILDELKREFSVLVKDVLQEQGKRLINKGLGGLYQAKIAGMMLSKHGYVEKSETDITTGGDKISAGTVLPDVIAEADRLLKERKLNQKPQ